MIYNFIFLDERFIVMRNWFFGRIDLKDIVKIVVILLLIVALFVVVKIDERREYEAHEWLREEHARVRAEERAKKEEYERKKVTDTFYQKLEDGIDTNILVIGDSIGGQKWTTILRDYLSRTYNQSNRITNVSMGGNASYAGYVRTMALNDNISYDLAIICYGQNDSLDSFSLYYESIIRAIKLKYPKCEIISILESSQRDYTEKIETIQAICNYYNIPVADTIKAFNDSEYPYEELAPDGVHPGETGLEIYADTVAKVIDERIGKAYDPTEIEPINLEISKFDTFKFYGVSEFNRLDDFTYEITFDKGFSALMGIDYIFYTGHNEAVVYVDDKEYVAPTVTFNYDFSQRHIMVITDNVTVEKSIKLVFATKEQADGFNGLSFSDIR